MARRRRSSSLSVRDKLQRLPNPKHVLEDHFDSWEAFINSAADQSLNRWEGYSRSTGWSRESFTKTATFDDAVDLALNGWPAGREKMLDTLAIVNPERASVASRAYDVAGQFPDIVRAIGGDPCSMVNTRRTMVAAHPVIRIDVSMSVSSGVDASEIEMRGAALLSVVDQLEAKGYQTELRCVFQAGDNENTEYYCSAVFKRAGDALDIDRAAFALTHPSVLRRLMFAVMEHHEHLERTLGHGYGYPRHSPAPDVDANTITIPAPQLDDDTYATAESARRKMAEVFAEYLES